MLPGLAIFAFSTFMFLSLVSIFYWAFCGSDDVCYECGQWLSCIRTFPAHPREERSRWDVPPRTLWQLLMRLLPGYFIAYAFTWLWRSILSQPFGRPRRWIAVARPNENPRFPSARSGFPYEEDVFGPPRVSELGPPKRRGSLDDLRSGRP